MNFTESGETVLRNHPAVGSPAALLAQDPPRPPIGDPLMSGT